MVFYNRGGKVMKKVIIIIVSIIVFGLVSGSSYYFIKNNESNNATYVIVSINPEIQLKLNKKDIVKEAIGLEAAGDLVLADLNLNGKTLSEAMDIIVKEMISTGYLHEYSENNIIISTIIARDEEKQLILEQEIAKTLEESLHNQNMPSLVAIRGVTDELKTKAALNNISNSKMILISKALELNNDLKEEDIIKDSVNKIQGYLKKQSKDRIDKAYENKESLIKAKENKKIEAKQIPAAIEMTYKLKNNMLNFKLNDEKTDKIIKEHLETTKEKVKQVFEKTNKEFKKNNNHYVLIKAETEKEVKNQIKNYIKNN